MPRYKVILTTILLLASLIRLFYLGKVPNGFTPDEASQAYTAYSLLKTGHDEWGTPWPISSFKSFLDYKAPLQTYLMIPSIMLFGLNEFSARLPSAIFGILSVLVIYFLTKKIFESDSKKEYIALTAALFLAISPWHLQFSRTALEVNLAAFLFPLGLYFFLEGLSKPRLFLLTAVSWSLCLYTYHSVKVFLPLFVLVILWGNLKSLVKHRSYLALPIITFILIASPLVYGTFWGSAAKRGADLLITSISSGQRESIAKESFYSKLSTISPKLPKVFHNSFAYSISKFTENYISYFSPTFWFTEGGREITYSVIPGRGLLYFWMLPLILYALFQILKDGKNKSVLMVILPWLLLAALPAALTKEGYRPNRAGSYALLWEILASYGLWGILSLRFKFKKYLVGGFLGVSLILTVFYFEDYWFGSRVNYPTALSYGWRETINYVNSIEKEYTHVMIQQGNQPQSFVAFYAKYNPNEFQSASSEWARQISTKQDINYLDQLSNYQLGKYRFETLNWPEDRNHDTLYVSKPDPLLPSDRRILHKVEIPEGFVFEIFDFPRIIPKP